MVKYTYNFIKNRKMNCIQLCLADIANVMCCAYEHIFLEIWDFDLERPVCMGYKYDETYQTINERLIELLTLYSPIKYIKSRDITGDLMDLCKSEIMLVEMDTYDCPWAVGYLWKHFSYYFIIRIDSESNKIFGYCPYDDVYSIEINEEIIRKALNAYIFKREKAYCMLSSEQFKKHLSAKMVTILPDTLFKKMVRFAEMLGELKDLNILKIDEGRIEDNIFVQRLAYIESSRYGMKVLFSKLFHDEALNCEMNEICKRWTKLKNDMIKGVITKRLFVINNLKRDVIEISNLEKAVYEKLNQIDDGIILMQ